MKHAEGLIEKIELTEKGARLTEEGNQYLFRVHPDANKMEIKQAVQRLFKVTVTQVNTLNRMGKAKRNRRGGSGFRTDWKRAVVSLKAGDKIEMT